MTKVKICGITNPEDALLSAEFGADMLGFNFYEKSPRYITPNAARQIIDQLPNKIINVGVFVNAPLDSILRTIDVAVLGAIQLHGDEDNRFIEEMHMMSSLPIIKAFRISPGFNLENAKYCSADAVLLDKYSVQRPGGTGETFDWKIAQVLSPDVERLYLAGGLNPKNVAGAIRTANPYAVDVASGVESKPGKKDPMKLEAFINNVKCA